jgi:hypothetical protein
MKIMEIEDLRKQWHELNDKQAETDDTHAGVLHDVLCDKLTVLHRLNELGETRIEDISIVDALEETNMLLRAMDYSEVQEPDLELV